MGRVSRSGRSVSSSANHLDSTADSRARLSLAEWGLHQDVLENGLAVARRDIAAAVYVAPDPAYSVDRDLCADGRARLSLAECVLHQDVLEDGLSVARRDIAAAVYVAPDTACAGWRRSQFKRADVTSRALRAGDAAPCRRRASFDNRRERRRIGVRLGRA
jgi:hypothetical protein